MSLTISIADPADQFEGRVSMRLTREALAVRLAPGTVEPELPAALAAAGQIALNELLAVERDPILVVRYHLDLAAVEPVTVEVSSYQVDVTVSGGLMPWETAAEVAAHSTQIVRRLGRM